MTLAFVLLAVMAAAMAFIRLSPTDLARWHVPPQVGDGQVTDGPQSMPGGAYTATVFESETAAELLTRLDGLVLVMAQTRRVAGSPETGLITWETRSAFWGFPDYTTAEAIDGATGASLRLVARQRFGNADFGVNAARLAALLLLLRAASAPVDSLSG